MDFGWCFLRSLVFFSLGFLWMGFPSLLFSKGFNLFLVLCFL